MNRIHPGVVDGARTHLFFLLYIVFAGDSDATTWRLVRLVADGTVPAPPLPPAPVDPAVALTPTERTYAYASLDDVRPLDGRIGVGMQFVPYAVAASGPMPLVEDDEEYTAVCAVCDLSQPASLDAAARLLRRAPSRPGAARLVAGVVPPAPLPRAVAYEDAE
ncbi:hypothetical protein HK405_007698, partial [Cladochytrium tenue]